MVKLIILNECSSKLEEKYTTFKKICTLAVNAVIKNLNIFKIFWGLN